MSLLPPKQSVDSGDLNYSPSGDAVYNFVSTTATNLGAVTKEPTGFVDRTTCTVSFSDSTRIFSIQPVSGSYDFYVKGVKFTKSGTNSVTIPNLDGANYIYFDASGNLTSTQSFTASLLTDYALVSIIYWNTITSSRVYWAEERHGLTMDGATHTYLHTVFGARFISGFALQNFSINGTGNLNADAQFTSDSGSIRDEDILIQALAQTQIPILYKVGTIWYKKSSDSYPVIYSGTAGFTGANGLLAYNQLVAGNWQLTEVPNNQFVLVHFFATNDIDNRVVGIQGINTYTSISGAREGAVSEISNLSGLPFAEFVPIGSVIFQTASTYSNAPKARVRSTDTGGNYVDFRGTQLYTPAAGNATSHSLLSNLTNDDHLQYLLVNGARSMTGALNMGINQINNVVDPLLSQDAATKNYVDASIVAYFAANANRRLKGYKTFTTPNAGIYTPTAGTNYVDMIIVGAGGGGGGAAGAANNTAAGAGGGAGGCIRVFTALTGAASYNFVIGSGGAGGSNSGGNGNNGGATSITIGANVYTASTGQGGKGQNTPGNAPTSTSFTAGGNGANIVASPLTGTYLNLPGNDGNAGYILNGFCAIPGLGGSSYFGSGGAITPGGGNGANGGGYGSGGGGGYSTGNAGKTGGNGAPGLIIIAEYA